MKQLSLIALLSIFIFSANASFAQDNNNRPQNGQGIENWIPDLTDAQKTELKTLRTAHIKEVQQIKNQMDIKRAELKALQTSENPDMTAINKKIEERSVLRTDLDKKTAAHKQAVRKVLTEDQRVVYDSKVSKRGAAHKCGGNNAAHNCGGNKPGHKCAGQGQKAPCNK